MVQNLLLIVMVLLCVLLIISILKRPFDSVRNPCKFKILSPVYSSEENYKIATFSIIVEKRHRYFINFPLLFKFYSENHFKSMVKVSYMTPGEEKQLVLDKYIEFTSKIKDHIVYITDVILGKIIIEIVLEVDQGDPIVGFEILENSTCELNREEKIELKFPN